MTDALPPLHAMDPTERFQDRGRAYAIARPSYPAEAVDAMLEGLGPPTGVTAADIGAGTGISSRLLADRGVDVFAVEPNEGMRSLAEPHPRVQFLPGTSEHTGIDTGWVNLVVCAQAFHWFNADPSLREFHRILSPGGRLAVVWNDRDNRDPLTARYSELVCEASENHPAATRMVSEAPLLATRLFEGIERRDFSLAQPLTLDGLIERARSASYVPNEGPALDKLIEGLRSAHRDHAGDEGLVHMHYVTRVYAGRRV